MGGYGICLTFYETPSKCESKLFSAAGRAWEHDTRLTACIESRRKDTNHREGRELTC